MLGAAGEGSNGQNLALEARKMDGSPVDPNGLGSRGGTGADRPADRPRSLGGWGS